MLLQSRFEVIIVEPGDCVNGLEEILALCNKIYMPVLEDRISLAKLKEFEDYLLLAGWDGLAGRISKHVMPYREENLDSGLLEYRDCSEIQRMAEDIMRREEHD